MTKFEIKIYFDTICPWCYIGEKALQRTLDLYQKTYPGGSQDEFTFDLRPYYLRAEDSATSGTPIPQRIAQRNGAERVNGITTRLARVGRENGIAFDFGGKVGNTRASHYLIYGLQKSEGEEKAVGLLSRVYAWHMESGGDVTDQEGLVGLAVDMGVKREVAKGWLEDEGLGREVDELARRAREAGISSVPTYEINGMRVEGAEDVAVLYEALVDARQRG